MTDSGQGLPVPPLAATPPGDSYSFLPAAGGGEDDPDISGGIPPKPSPSAEREERFARRRAEVERYCGPADPPWVVANLRLWQKGSLVRLGVGDLIAVARRCHTGDNFPGGAALITATHSGYFYDVRYITGGVEKHVDGCFCSMIKFDDKSRRRKRGPGRCLNCGSFILDCGGCRGAQGTAFATEVHAPCSSKRVKSRSSNIPRNLESVEPRAHEKVAGDQLACLDAEHSSCALVPPSGTTDGLVVQNDETCHAASSTTTDSHLLEESSGLILAPVVEHSNSEGEQRAGTRWDRGQLSAPMPSSPKELSYSALQTQDVVFESIGEEEFQSQQVSDHVAIFESTTSAAPVQGHEGATYTIGEVVEVESRQTPGINKEGGVARITKIHDDGTYDVEYIVRGGVERGIENIHISKCQLDIDRGRHTMGRCRRPDCNSFIVHCNHWQPPSAAELDAQPVQLSISDSEDDIRSLAATGRGRHRTRRRSAVLFSSSDEDDFLNPTGYTDTSLRGSGTAARPHRRKVETMYSDSEEENYEGFSATLSAPGVNDEDTSDDEDDCQDEDDGSDARHSSESDPSDTEIDYACFSAIDPDGFIVPEGKEAAEDLPGDIVNPLQCIKDDPVALQTELTRLLDWLSSEGLPNFESGIRRLRRSIHLLLESQSSLSSFQLGQEIDMLEGFSLEHITRRGVDIANWCWRKLSKLKPGFRMRDIAWGQLIAFDSRIAGLNSQLKKLKDKYLETVDNAADSEDHYTQEDDGDDIHRELLVSAVARGAVQKDRTAGVKLRKLAQGVRSKKPFKPFYVRYAESCSRSRHKRTVSRETKRAYSKEHAPTQHRKRLRQQIESDMDLSGNDLVANIGTDGTSVPQPFANRFSELPAPLMANKRVRKGLRQHRTSERSSSLGLRSLVEDLGRLPAELSIPSHRTLHVAAAYGAAEVHSNGAGTQSHAKSESLFWCKRDLCEAKFGGLLLNSSSLERAGSHVLIRFIITRAWFSITDAGAHMMKARQENGQMADLARVICGAFAVISGLYSHLSSASRQELHCAAASMITQLWGTEPGVTRGLENAFSDATNGLGDHLLQLHSALRCHLLQWIDDAHLHQFARNLLLELLSLYECNPLAEDLPLTCHDSHYKFAEDVKITPLLALWITLVRTVDSRDSAGFWQLFLDVVMLDRTGNSSRKLPAEAVWSALLFVCRLYLYDPSPGEIRPAPLWECVQHLQIDPDAREAPAKVSAFVFPPEATTNPSMYARVLMERTEFLARHWPPEKSVLAAIVSSALKNATGRQSIREQRAEGSIVTEVALRAVHAIETSATEPGLSFDSCASYLDSLLASFCLPCHSSALALPGLWRGGKRDDDGTVCKIAVRIVVNVIKRAPRRMEARRICGQVIRSLSTFPTCPRGNISVLLALQEAGHFESATQLVEDFCQASTSALAANTRDPTRMDLNLEISPDRLAILLVPAAALIWRVRPAPSTEKSKDLSLFKRLIGCVVPSLQRLADLSNKVVGNDNSRSKLQRISAAAGCAAGSLSLMISEQERLSFQDTDAYQPLLGPLSGFLTHVEQLDQAAGLALLSACGCILRAMTSSVRPDTFPCTGGQLGATALVAVASSLDSQVLPALRELGDRLWRFRASALLLPKSEKSWAMDARVLNLQVEASVLALGLASPDSSSCTVSKSLCESHLRKHHQLSSSRFATISRTDMGTCLHPAYFFSRALSRAESLSRIDIASFLLKGREWDMLEMWMVACMHPLTLSGLGEVQSGPPAQLGRDLTKFASQIDHALIRSQHELAGVFACEPPGGWALVSVGISEEERVTVVRAQLLWSVIVHLRGLWVTAKEKAQAGRGDHAKALKDRIAKLIRAPISLMGRFFGPDWDLGGHRDLRAGRFKELHVELCYSYSRMLARLMSEAVKGPILIELVGTLYGPVMHPPHPNASERSDMPLAVGIRPWALRYVPDILVCFSQLAYSQPPVFSWIDAILERSIRRGADSASNVHEQQIIHRSFAIGLGGGGYIKTLVQGQGCLDSVVLARPTSVEYLTKLRQLRRSLFKRLDLLNSLQECASASCRMGAGVFPAVQRSLMFLNLTFKSLSGKHELRLMIEEIEPLLLPLYCIVRTGLSNNHAAAALDVALRVLELKTPDLMLLNVAANHEIRASNPGLIKSLEMTSFFVSALSLSAATDLIRCGRTVPVGEDEEELSMALSEAELGLFIMGGPPGDNSGSRLLPSTIESIKRLSSLIADKDEYFVASKWLSLLM
jgi:hypothetical protein